MTGVAARESRLLGSNPGAAGVRKGILSDLSTLPAFIASNLNTKASQVEVQQVFLALLKKAQKKYGKYFTTQSSDNKDSGVIHYCVWSDIFLCSSCSEEFSFWEGAISLEKGEQRDPFPCPHCGATQKKRSLSRAFTTSRDAQTGEIYKRPKRELVYINYKSDGSRFSKVPSDEDVQKALDLENSSCDSWIPTESLPKQDRYYKDGLHLVSLDNYHRFYFPRTLHVLGFLWGEINSASIPKRLRNPLKFILTSMLDRNLTIRNRFVVNKYNPKGRINGPLANTLYVPGLSVEQNPIEALRYKSKEVLAAFRDNDISTIVSNQSLSSLAIPEDSIDYIFVDPPFGHNIMYSELNGVSESWLQVRTNADKEAIVSPAQEKGTFDYTTLMKECFKLCFNVLKPGRWMTVEFHNSKNSIWNSIQEAIAQAGFVVADVRTLDKKKGTINQEYYTAGSVKQDLVISAYKPNDGLEDRFKLKAGTEDGVWDFVRTHLGQLPVCVTSNDQVEILAERQGYLLFDRMVAFHVQRNVAVPMSAAEFYLGLSQRFSSRDEMFFLPEQVAEYDKKRLTAGDVRQLSLLVSDEASAIQWLKQHLSRKPQSYQDLHPQFLKELGGWSKNETQLDLRDLLQQNFLCYDGTEPVPEQIHAYLSSNWKDLRNLPKESPVLKAKAKERWYVPDPNKAGDLEKLREKSLLKEFEEYREATRKLKVFRLEAVRAGFKKAWQERAYETIISVAEKIPNKVLEEDPKLLMWYDQAITRSGDE